jgi:hypothetical protein
MDHRIEILGRLCVRDNYGWAVVEKSTNHCVVRWVLNSFAFYLLSYKIIDMYIQRLLTVVIK